MSIQSESSVVEQLKQIVEGGFCIGCGACNFSKSKNLPIILNSYGMYQLNLSSIDTWSKEETKNALYTCPFSNLGPDEDEIGKTSFGEESAHDCRLGHYRALYVGHVEEGNFRERGSSGGILTWILAELLQGGKVDGIVHVKKDNDPKDNILFRYAISRSLEEVRAGAKSRYYPIELSGVLDQIRKTQGRFALVGLPCFLKAVRRRVEIDPVLKDRVSYYIGLVCGHLKSKAFADCFGWQAGISPGKLEEIDFRVKLSRRPASDYGVFLHGSGVTVTKPTRELLGSNWGYNMFRYSACDYCDDVFAEVADIAVGDAWLPGYKEKPEGASVVIIRNKQLGEMVRQANQDGRLKVLPVTSDTIADSQAGGLRDRREGLAYRLSLKKELNEWAPRKRVAPDKYAARGIRRKIYRSRINLMEMSHIAWREAVVNGQFDRFAILMNNAIRKHKRIGIFQTRRIVSILKNKFK